MKRKRPTQSDRNGQHGQQIGLRSTRSTKRTWTVNAVNKSDLGPANKSDLTVNTVQIPTWGGEGRAILVYNWTWLCLLKRVPLDDSDLKNRRSKGTFRQSLEILDNAAIVSHVIYIIGRSRSDFQARHDVYATRSVGSVRYRFGNEQSSDRAPRIGISVSDLAAACHLTKGLEAPSRLLYTS